MMRVIMLIGFSGAGKSVALKIFGDLGYEAIDNLPLPIITPLVKTLASERTKLALCSDVRSRDFSSEQLLELRESLKRDYPEAQIDLVFLACDEHVLLRRFTETRHSHPLSQDLPVADGIRLEAQLLDKARNQADMVLDTTDFGPHDLKRILTDLYGEAATTLKVNLLSFSYRRGLPRDADMVIDVRFLQNPHYVPSLRENSGKDSQVGHFIRQDPEFTPFYDRLVATLDQLLPLYAKEGKSYFTLAIGCTGGKHRSVFTVEALAECLRLKKINCFVRHRELDS
ncbi:MAG: RNase adapter RapZ [Rickettsiales bacterium]|nr:RNase adapter RapZ [Rickettsiales bacterium]